jgi:hypothetical protein
MLCGLLFMAGYSKGKKLLFIRFIPYLVETVVLGFRRINPLLHHSQREFARFRRQERSLLNPTYDSLCSNCCCLVSHSSLNPTN